MVLAPGGDAVLRQVDADFYQNLAADFGSFSGHVLIAQHDCDEPWTGWEMHPLGDEFVCLIEGEVDFILWRDGGEQTLRLDTQGMYVVVPKGIWHTARPHRPSRLLFATPGEGTQHGQPPGWGKLG